MANVPWPTALAGRRRCRPFIGSSSESRLVVRLWRLKVEFSDRLLGRDEQLCGGVTEQLSGRSRQLCGGVTDPFSGLDTVVWGRERPFVSA